MSDPADFLRTLIGATCSAVVVQEFWHHGVCVDPVNVVFLRTDAGTWVRYFFDAGVFFWREAAPETSQGGEPTYAYRLVDSTERWGLAGERIVNAEFSQPDRDCARLTVRFECGTLRLDHANDRSRIVYVEGSPR